MVIQGFFRTATDARYAIRDFKRLDLDPSVPTPVEPVNGRPWRVDVEPEAGLSDRHPPASLVNQVVAIIDRHSGTSTQVDRV